MVPMLIILPNKQGALPKSQELAENGVIVSTAIANPHSTTCSPCPSSNGCTTTASTGRTQLPTPLNGDAAQSA
jgi:hypothetical protein